MKTLDWTDASSAENLLQQAQQEEIVVMRDGLPVAVVMPIDADDADWFKRETDPNFIESIKRAREDVKVGRAISHEEMKKQFGL